MYHRQLDSNLAQHRPHSWTTKTGGGVSKCRCRKSCRRCRRCWRLTYAGRTRRLRFVVVVVVVDV